MPKVDSLQSHAPAEYTSAATDVGRALSPVRVGLYAPLGAEGAAGGVEQLVIGLVNAFSKLGPAEVQCTVFTHPRNPDWLTPYAGSNVRLVTVSRASRLSWARAGTLLRRVVNGTRVPSRARAHVLYEPQVSDGFIESFDLDVVHFPFQEFIHTNVPSIFNPHDLQHLHYPCNFHPETVAAREVYYPVACRAATRVAVGFSWVKEDVCEKYGISPSLVDVIPLAPPTSVSAPITEEVLSQVKATLKLPTRFALYPAHTWPHKNHGRLISAFRRIVDAGCSDLHLVCTGGWTEHYRQIALDIDAAGLQSRVHFLGFVSAEHLKALYRLATMVIVPTLFEAGSFPVYEAFAEGVPVACSNVTSLPEQAGNAAVLFDPKSVADIEHAIRRLDQDPALREALVEAGHSQIADFTWQRTACGYLDTYRAAMSATHFAKVAV
jgi:glycosyltransferase involved in cell wall biosynthesis